MARKPRSSGPRAHGEPQDFAARYRLGQRAASAAERTWTSSVRGYQRPRRPATGARVEAGAHARRKIPLPLDKEQLPTLRVLDLDEREYAASNCESEWARGAQRLELPDSRMGDGELAGTTLFVRRDDTAVGLDHPPDTSSRRSCWRRSGRSPPATRSWHRRFAAGGVERPRARDPARGRPRAIEHGDRGRSAHRRAHGQDLSRPAALEARPP
jgi:hypothetical protein